MLSRYAFLLRTLFHPFGFTLNDTYSMRAMMIRSGTDRERIRDIQFSDRPGMAAMNTIMTIAIRVMCFAAHKDVC
ncbi:hypothetical protein KN63_06485 [Smithella sp. F21]|nr:hypothetical protein KN63_06485 [Smithella sp. F21]